MAKFSLYTKPNIREHSDVCIFFPGVGGDGGIRRRGGGGGGGYREASEESGGMARPKLELNIKVDREAEEERLRSLLRDDFIDDLKEGSFVPVQLPMIETGQIDKFINI